MVREMSPDRWKRVEALFHEALTRPPADRAAFLASACSGDEALRREVESLLDEKISDDGVIGGAVNAARVAEDTRPSFAHSVPSRSVTTISMVCVDIQ